MNAAGALIYSRDTSRFLFLRRSDLRTRGQWALVGGGVEESDSTVYGGLIREIREELGVDIKPEKIIPISFYVNPGETFEYQTFLLVVNSEFRPFLNHEHDLFCWAALGDWPHPLHHGVDRTLHNRINILKIQSIIDHN